MNKTALDNNMNQIFDLPVEAEESSLPVVAEESQPIKLDVNLDSDFAQSRSSMDKIEAIGQEALLSLLYVAKQTDDPEAYKEVANLIKALADVNQNKIDLHVKIHKIKNSLAEKNKPVEQPNGQPGVTTNNAIFVGNTSELLNLIKNMGANEIDITGK